jgi:hypothetical protein
MEMPWFVLENLAYRKLLHITKYWQGTQNHAKGVDPFEPQKESSLRMCLRDTPESFLQPFVDGGIQLADSTIDQQRNALSKVCAH